MAGSGGAALGYYDDAELFVAEIVLKFSHVVLAYVLSGEEHPCACSGAIGGKTVGQRFDYGLGAKIAAADAHGNHHLAGLAKACRSGVDVVEKSVVGFFG